MRVLLVSDFYPPEPGGLEAHVARLGRQLRARGHDVLVATVGADRRDGEVAVRGLPLDLAHVPGAGGAGERTIHPPWRDRGFTRALAGVVDDFGPDMVHAHGWSAFSAAALCRVRRLPLVVTVHDAGLRCPARTLACGDPGRWRACVRCRATNQPVRVRLPLTLALARGIRAQESWRFIAVSQAVAATLPPTIPPEQVRVIPNFVVDGDRRPSPPPAHGPILFVGPPTAAKGLPLLEAAYARLAERGVRARLLLVGEGHRGTLGRGIVAPGHLDGAALRAAYREATVVAVCPTVADACPTVALEALRAGRPVVATAVGGLPELVEAGETGLLVVPGDPEALARALAHVIGNRFLARRLGAAAWERSRSFWASAVVPRVEAVYEEART